MTVNLITCCYGQADSHRGSSADMAVDFNISAKFFAKLFGDVEPKASAVLFAAFLVIDVRKRFEEFFLLFCRHSRAIVLDNNKYPFIHAGIINVHLQDDVALI